MSSLTVDNVTCPVCGGHTFDEEYVPKKMYICTTETEANIPCGHIQAYCKRCEKLYDGDEFGKHGDVWECKECGTVCWPLTDMKRRQEAALERLAMMKRRLNNLGF